MMIDHLPADLNIRYERDALLGPLTWFGVGGPAKILAYPSSIPELTHLVSRADECGARVYVLGSGANLLVAEEGVDGVVVRLSAPGFRQIRFEDRIVHVGAGFDLMKLVLTCARRGLSGIECMAGIPASVGGAVRMNAGGSFGDIGNCVKRVTVMDTTGRVEIRERDELVFRYRSTNLETPFILEVDLELESKDSSRVMKQVKEVFRYKKSRQPLGDRSAGCAFKNPGPTVGASAGELIDRAGLKGFCVGQAQVSDLHANFIVARPGCSSRDVFAVMHHMQATVMDQFGVKLEPEVIRWP